MTDRAGRLALAAATVVVLLGLGLNLAGYPLLDPDEGRNAEVAREMAQSNDFILPRLNTLPYVDKPVVFFAAGALSIKALGPTAFAARLPSLVFTLATLVVVWWFGRRLFGAEAGWTAALIAGASPLTLGFSRTVIMDSALTLLVTLSVAGFYLSAEKDERAEWWSALAWGAMGLGVLTKGPIAIALPLMIAIPYVAWRRAWRAVFDPVGLLLFLALILPWVRAISLRVPDYFRYVLVTETFQRLTTPALQRTGPWWYFPPILLLGTLPWGFLAAARISRPTTPADRRIVLLLLWVFVPLLFFSLSQSKRPQYMLPLVPSVALLAAALWTKRGVRAAAAALTILGALLLVTSSRLPGLIRGMSPEIASAVAATAIPLALVCIAAGAAAFLIRRSAPLALLALSLPCASIPLLSRRLMSEIGKERSTAALGQAITPVLLDATEVVGVHAYPPSLPFYLHRTLTLASDDARELTSNYIMRTVKTWNDTPGSPLRPADWWKDAAVGCERPRIFVVALADREALLFLGERLPLIAQSGKYAAFGPCGGQNLAMRSQH